MNGISGRLTRVETRIKDLTDMSERLKRVEDAQKKINAQIFLLKKQMNH